MKNKFNNGRYSSNYISPKLKKLFIHFKNKVSVKDLKVYIKLLNLFIDTNLEYANNKLEHINLLHFQDQKKVLSELDTLMYNALQLVTSITEECTAYYNLTPQQSTMINYNQDRMDYISRNIYNMLCDVSELREDPNFFEDNGFLDEEEYVFEEDIKQILFMPINLN